VPRYIAFLRAINVGGHVVKMDRLRALFEALRFRNVETFIASGNVLFDTRSDEAAALEPRIERHLETELGYAVGTFLRTPAEVAAIASHEPFADLEPSDSLYVGFLKSPPTEERREKLLALRTDVDDFHVYDRELYWRLRTRLSESKVTGAKLERAIGPTTLRNVTTVRKLAGKTL
jgi:uncharacterized protein (DUF1697 family)